MDGYHQYRWVGVNRTGQTVHGRLDAKTLTLAKIVLHQQGIQTQKIKQAQGFLGALKNIRIQSRHITHLTRRLATLLQSQIPLLQAFELLKHSEENPRMRQLLTTIQADIESGLPLADAFRKHPQYFNPLFCHIIQAGEVSGALTTLLEQLSNHREARETLSKNIRKSLAYPIAIFSIACIVTIGLLLFVVPQFQLLFTSFDAHLPTATQCLITGSKLIKTYGLSILLLGIISLYALRYIYQKSHITALKIDTLILKLPVIGITLTEIILARLTQTLSILLSAGMPLVEALKTAANITNNLCYAKAMLTIQTAITEGHPLQHTLETTGLFPNIMIQIVGIGEASGQLNHMLKHLALQQNEALKHKLEIQSSLFEPILMAVLGLWVGGLIIALYLPIFQLGAIVS